MGSSDTLAEAVAVRDSAQLVFSPEQIATAIDRMADWVSGVSSTACPTLLAIMSGGVFTATRLCGRLQHPYRFDFVHGMRYGDEITGADLSWPVPPSVSLAGQTVVVVDDILDRGVTLADLLLRLEDIGVTKVYSAVLISKRLDTLVERPSVDFVGLEIDDIYVFGCGMDYKGYWRGLPGLYSVNDS